MYTVHDVFAQFEFRTQITHQGTNNLPNPRCRTCTRCVEYLPDHVKKRVSDDDLIAKLRDHVPTLFTQCVWRIHGNGHWLFSSIRKVSQDTTRATPLATCKSCLELHTQTRTDIPPEHRHTDQIISLRITLPGQPQTTHHDGMYWADAGCATPPNHELQMARSTAIKNSSNLERMGTCTPTSNQRLCHTTQSAKSVHVVPVGAIGGKPWP